MINLFDKFKDYSDVVCIWFCREVYINSKEEDLDEFFFYNAVSE